MDIKNETINENRVIIENHLKENIIDKSENPLITALDMPKLDPKDQDTNVDVSRYIEQNVTVDISSNKPQSQNGKIDQPEQGFKSHDQNGGHVTNNDKSMDVISKTDEIGDDDDEEEEDDDDDDDKATIFLFRWIAKLKRVLYRYR